MLNNFYYDCDKLVLDYMKDVHNADEDEILTFYVAGESMFVEFHSYKKQKTWVHRVDWLQLLNYVYKNR